MVGVAVAAGFVGITAVWVGVGVSISASASQSNWSDAAAASPPHALTATTSHLYVLPWVMGNKIFVVVEGWDSLFLIIVLVSSSVTVTLKEDASAWESHEQLAWARSQEEPLQPGYSTVTPLATAGGLHV